MKQVTLIASSLVAFASGFSLAASAQESTFEKDFVTRTVLGNWQPSNHEHSIDKPNVDASLGEFAASIWGKYPRLTEEQHSQGKATAESFTKQFK